MRDPGTCYGNFLLLSFSYYFKRMLLALKKFNFHVLVQKCYNGKIEKLPKWHFLTRAWNLNFFWPKSTLLRHYENCNKKKFLWHVPGSAKTRIYAAKSTKRGFSKKPPWELKKSCMFFRFLWIPQTPEWANWKRLTLLINIRSCV